MGGDLNARNLTLYILYGAGGRIATSFLFYTQEHEVVRRLNISLRDERRRMSSERVRPETNNDSCCNFFPVAMAAHLPHLTGSSAFVSSRRAYFQILARGAFCPLTTLFAQSQAQADSR